VAQLHQMADGTPVINHVMGALSAHKLETNGAMRVLSVAPTHAFPTRVDAIIRWIRVLLQVRLGALVYISRGQMRLR
jgi:hypothetical protein